MRTMIASLVMATTFMAAHGVGAESEVTRAELSNDAGTVNEFNGKGNSFDVVKLTLDSDGSHLLVTVKLTAKPGTMAGSAVELYIDSDNDTKTGGKTEWGPGGFEHVVEVGICIVDATGKTCTGGSSQRIKLTHAAKMVETFKGTAGQEMDFRNLSMTVSHLESPETPIEGSVVADKVRYSDLGAKKGQVLRIAARESDGKDAEKSFFPDVLLKLK